MSTNRNQYVSFIALLAVLVLLEALSARLAYHTVGAVFSGLMYLAIALNLVPLVMYLAHRHLLATALALVLGLALVVPQVVFGERLYALQAEAARIVAYAYDTRAQTGAFPASLDGYTFADPGLAEHFHEYGTSEEQGGLYVSYWVSTPSTSHYYSVEHGWGYYPD